MDPIFITGQVLSLSDREPLSNRMVALRYIHPPSDRDPDGHPAGGTRSIYYSGPIAVHSNTGSDGEFLLAIGVESNTAWIGGYFGINVYGNSEGTGALRMYRGNLQAYANIVGILRAVGIIRPSAISSVVRAASQISQYCSGSLSSYRSTNFGVPEAIRTGRDTTRGGRVPGVPAGRVLRTVGRPFGMDMDMTRLAVVAGAVIVCW